MKNQGLMTENAKACMPTSTLADAAGDVEIRLWHSACRRSRRHSSRFDYGP